MSVSKETVASSANRTKRTIARKIERYHLQLTKGCGNSDCSNRSCASCPNFLYKDLDSNAAAAMALDLMKDHAPLCGLSSPKSYKTHGSVEHHSVPPPNPVIKGDHSSPPDISSCSNRQREQLTSSESTQANSSCSGAAKSETPTFITEEGLVAVIDSCQQKNSWTELNRYLGAFFHPESLMLSFPCASASQSLLKLSSSKELLRSFECDHDKDLDEQECDNLESLSDVVIADESVDKKHSSFASLPDLSVDIASLRRAIMKLFSIPDTPFLPTLVNAVIFLSRTLEMDLRSMKMLTRSKGYINLFVIIMEIPVLGSPEFLEMATPQFLKTVGLLPDEIQASLAKIWALYDAQHLSSMVGHVQQLITVRIVSEYQMALRPKSVHDDDAITGAVKLLKILYYASAMGGRWDAGISSATASAAGDDPSNYQLADDDEFEDLQDFINHPLFSQLLDPGRRRRRENWVDPLQDALKIRPFDCREPLVSPDDFINEPLSDIIEMDKDFINYRTTLDGESSFTFMLYPFVLTPVVKHRAMYFDNRIRMMSERRTAVLQRLIGEPTSHPYLRLHVRRDHLIEDALLNLADVAAVNPQDLKKQLFVEFEGEQGIDEGGLSKEFFQLIIEELFNPDIGMFTYDENTRIFWFNSMSFETDAQYKLIGIVLGLAIYNDVILDIHFPMVVYRKLMGKTGVFEDLKTSHPTLARSLQEMLDYDGDVAEVFMQPFSIGMRDVFGGTHVHHLKENGDQIIVTNETRREFVDLYANYLLNESIEKQFNAFKKGFSMVTDESPLEILFRPEEVELLICGNKHYDFNDLERSTQYDGGFTADSPAIKNFWEVVHDLTDDQKRQLLQFTTGSDRVPVGGLSQLKLVIARNGPHSERLPTAHTCFNVLLLPDYESKDVLRDRLLKAITYSKGFGML